MVIGQLLVRFFLVRAGYGSRLGVRIDRVTTTASVSTRLGFAYFCQVVLLDIYRDRLTPVSIKLVTRAGGYVASYRLLFLIVCVAAAAVEQEEVLLCH